MPSSPPTPSPPRAQRLSSPLPRHATALLTGLCLLLSAHAAQAARLALVVGNDSYRHVDPLKNAVRDAELMHKTLADAGFQVTLQRNLGRQALYDAVDQFQRRVNNGDEVVFFFAGHGVQVASDQVLLPVDIQADDEKKVLREGVPLLYVQEALKGARLALVVVDACRDNPFPKTGGTRSIGDSRGLKPPEAAKGQAVILSAGRGEKALDTVPGQPTARNGLFTWEFAQVLRTPGLDVLTALRRVRDRVEDRAATVGHQQRPSLVDDLRGQFYLAAGPQGPESKPEPAPVAQIQPQPQPQPVVQQSPAPAQVDLSRSEPAVSSGLVNQAAAAPAAAPALIEGRYQVLGDGSEVKDVQTGLVWARCSVGQRWDGKNCAGEAKKFTFDDAQKPAWNGWRVPTIRELATLIYCSSGKTQDLDDPKDGGGAIANYCDGEHQRPTIREQVFPNTPATWYWSSSPYARGAKYAWGVGFGYGGVHDHYGGRDGTGQVRLVRASQ